MWDLATVSQSVAIILKDHVNNQCFLLLVEKSSTYFLTHLVAFEFRFLQFIQFQKRKVQLQTHTNNKNSEYQILCNKKQLCPSDGNQIKSLSCFISWTRTWRTVVSPNFISDDCFWNFSATLWVHQLSYDPLCLLCMFLSTCAACNTLNWISRFFIIAISHFLKPAPMFSKISKQKYFFFNCIYKSKYGQNTCNAWSNDQLS